MERLQGPINPCFLGEHLNVDYLDQPSSLDFSYGGLLGADSFKLGEPFNFSFDDKMPFLQLLGLQTPSFQEPSFQVLLRLEEQKKKPWTPSYLESRIINHSPTVKFETKEYQQQQHPLSSSGPEAAGSQEPTSSEARKEGNSGSSPMWTPNQTAKVGKLPAASKEKRKRKRTKPSKNREEVESQRMTHIAVERNRRKQMNDHLNALRSLMPSSFIQRGDQASIIGGAIDFVKELEQLLQSLQAQKRKREREQREGSRSPPDSSTPFNGFFTSPQYTCFSASSQRDAGEATAETKSLAVADIEVTVIQSHVNLKVLSPRRPGQLLKAINALEGLSLSILHLNVTSLDRSVLYSFNLKIEEDCKLGTADEIAAAVYQTFCYIKN